MRRFSLIAVLLLIGCSRHLPDGSHEKPFDEVLWRSPQGLEPDNAGVTPRQKMLGDLVDKHLIGKSRKDIIAILGEPSTKMDPDGTGPSMSYRTGIERGSFMPIDSEWLLLYFDSSGVATRYTIGVD